MRAKINSWTQRFKMHFVATILIILLVCIVVLISLSILGYIFNWDWTGLNPYISPPHTSNRDFLRGKTLWDWMQLLIIPIVIAVGGYLFSFTINRNEQIAANKRTQAEREIAQDNQREVALQEYIDKISELLLHEKLRESQTQDEVRTIARVRTLTTLPRLDEVRKGSVLQFLYEAILIDEVRNIVDLDGADLSCADLRHSSLLRANLSRANLRHANISNALLLHANLTEADLRDTNLYQAKLGEADLSAANLSRANLSYADLRGKTILSYADLREANLSYADLKFAQLEGTNLQRAILVETYLRLANLKYAELNKANLRKATLWDADLTYADLREADLREADLKGGDDLKGANLEGANLEGANLEGANITKEQLKQALSLKGTIMPDGSINS